MGASILQDHPWVLLWYAEARSLSALARGRVRDALSRPIRGAVIEVWQSAPNGLYAQQDPTQTVWNLCGRFETKADGRYSFICNRPTAYPIPTDGPVGGLLVKLDRPATRPGHIHFKVSAPGYFTLTTQVFDREHSIVDPVFAVKDRLKVLFEKNDEQTAWQFRFNVKLERIP